MIGRATAERILRWVMRRPERQGFFHHARARRGGRLPWPWRSPAYRPRRLPPGKQVVVVGNGIAALTLVRTLRRFGVTGITVVHREDAFGGRCVHTGCIPAELTLAHALADNAARGALLKSLQAKLSAEARQAFEAAGVTLVAGTAQAIVGRELQLTDGRKLAFSRLVLASGRDTEPPPGLPVSPERSFWDRENGTLVFLSDGNPAALSYAELARVRGCQAAVVFTSPPITAHLPSYRYFEQNAAEAGIRIYRARGVVATGPGELACETASGTEPIAFDALFCIGQPGLSVPPIDGRAFTLFDWDYSTASLRARPDIFAIGDAAGMISASEAELQADRLARSWVTGAPIEATDFASLPYRLHGRQSLAWVGSPWSLLREDWRSIDFSQLVWSRIHGESGRLWYLYDERRRRVESIHLCHRDAGQLAAIASALIAWPIDDARWLATSVHPGPAEIFKKVVEDIESRHAPRRLPRPVPGVPESPPVPSAVRLPSLRALKRAAFFEAFTARERVLGTIDTEPRIRFSLLAAIKLLATARGLRANGVSLERDAAGRYFCAALPDLEVSTDAERGIAVAASGRLVTAAYCPP